MDNKVMGSGDSVIDISSMKPGYKVGVAVESKSNLTIDHSIISKNIVKLDFKLPEVHSRFNEVFNRAIIIAFVRLYNEKVDILPIESKNVIGQIVYMYNSFRNICKTSNKYNLKISDKINPDVMLVYEMLYGAIKNPAYTSILMGEYDENNA